MSPLVTIHISTGYESIYDTLKSHVRGHSPLPSHISESISPHIPCPVILCLPFAHGQCAQPELPIAYSHWPVGNLILVSALLSVSLRNDLESTELWMSFLSACQFSPKSPLRLNLIHFLHLASHNYSESRYKSQFPNTNTRWMFLMLRVWLSFLDLIWNSVFEMDRPHVGHPNSSSLFVFQCIAVNCVMTGVFRPLHFLDKVLPLWRSQLFLLIFLPVHPHILEGGIPTAPS